MANKFKDYSYQINLVPEVEGGYTVTAPALPGCVSYGKTVEEAIKNAKEAIELHLENLTAHQRAIPQKNLDKPVFTPFIQVKEPRYA